MEDERFDALTRMLAKPVSRRQVLKAVVATAMGGLLGGSHITEVGAKSSRQLPCSRLPESTCCSYCQALFPTNPVAALECYVVYVGSRGRRGPCTCLKGNGTACVTNPAWYNAYTCCNSTQTCIQRICCSAHCTSCTSATHCTGCAPGYTVCSGTCRNLSTDTNNCSHCGTTCTGTTPACCSGMCKDLDSDVTNCGQCGHVCNSGETCVNGACECGTGSACATGYTCVNGGCFNTNCESPPFQGSACGTGCADCRCEPDANGSGNFCVDGSTFEGYCTSDTDCPQGTLCSTFLSGTSPPHLCTRPCPCPSSPT
jgi:hypothetical protein